MKKILLKTASVAALLLLQSMTGLCFAQTDTTGLEQILITGGPGLTESTDLLLDDLSHQTHIRFHDFLLLRCHDAFTSPS